MNLYLIEAGKWLGYDTYNGAVVAAKSEEDARTIHPGNQDEWGDANRTWVATPADVATVKLIGVAAPGIERGPVLSDYHAG